MSVNIDSGRMISVTKLQKELTRRIREVSSSGDALYVLKNNEMEAVIMSPGEYEYLTDLNDMIEQIEIGDMIKKRLKNYSRIKNVGWDELKK